MNARLFIKRNSATILSFMAIAGVVATAVTTAKATPKAITALENGRGTDYRGKGKDGDSYLYSVDHNRCCNDHVYTWF